MKVPTAHSTKQPHKYRSQPDWLMRPYVSFPYLAYKYNFVVFVVEGGSHVSSTG